MECTDILKQRGIELFNQPHSFIQFTNIDEIDHLLNDLENNPHIFVLACLMHQQITAERAWKISHVISRVIGDHSFEAFLSLELEELTHIFETQGLHRFNEKMAKVFYLGLERIQNVYAGNVANIWLDNPSSAKVVRRFLEFYGAGIKIATMTTNILARDFKIPMSDHTLIDISPDTHVIRVFRRLGIVRTDADIDEIIYLARELNPLYPGIFDLSAWEVGRDWCRPTNPLCHACYLNTSCAKQGL